VLASGSFLVNGNEPASGSDTLTASGASANWTPGTGLLAVDGVTLTVGTVEALLFDGEGAGTVTVSGAGDFLHTPGRAADEGRVDLSSGSVTYLGLNYENLGLAGTVTASGTGAEDSLTALGTDTADDIRVAFTGSNALAIGILSSYGQHVELRSTGVESYYLDSAQGGFDDVFLDTPVNATGEFEVYGGGPADALYLTSAGPVTAVTIRPQAGSLTAGEIAGFGTPVIRFGEMQAVRYTGYGSDTLIVDPGEGDHTVRVDNGPSENVDRVTSDTLPEIQFTGVDTFRVYQVTETEGSLAVTFVTSNLEGAAQYETDLEPESVLVIEGREGLADDFSVAAPPGSFVAVSDRVSGVTVTDITAFAAVGRVVVQGLGGSDAVTVTPLAGTAVFVDGGEPVGGATGDALTLTVTTAVTYQPGPESGTGRFDVVGAQAVSFARVELLAVDGDGGDGVTVNGTNADNDINVVGIAGNGGNNDFTVSVDGGPAVSYTDFNALTVNGLAGDDDIDVDVNNLVLASGSFLVNGNEPAAGSDTLTASGTSASWTPGTGLLVVDGVTLTVGTIEALLFDGEGSGNLTVNGTAGADTLVHRPGAADNAGSIAVNNLLPISYEDLATGLTALNIAGLGGADTLEAYGLAGNDTFVVPGREAIDVNARVRINTSGVEHYRLCGLEGDDTFRLQAPLSVSTVSVLGGGPGGSDVLEILGDATANDFEVLPGYAHAAGEVRVDGVSVPYAGVEHLQLDAGGNAGDSLIVRATAETQGDNLWTVRSGTYGDLVQIDARESIDIWGFDDVELINELGSDLFRVEPTSTAGYNSLTVTGGGTLVDDVLEILGTPAGDAVISRTSTTAAVDTVVVNGRPVTAGAGLVEIRLNTLAGDDNIDLDLDLAGVHKVVDAGDGNDVVNLLGTSDATIFGGDGDDTLTGSPLADLIFGGRGNDVLIGVGGADTIYGEEGDDIFGNPSATPNGAADDAGDDRFFGGPGSDLFLWEPGDGSDTIEGGGGTDVLAFFGSAADETFNVFAKLSDPARAILFRSADGSTMDMAGVEQINVSGQGGADRFVVGRANDGDSGDDLAPTSPYTDPTATLSDLSTTEVRVVNVDVGVGDAGDLVFVDGRPLNDNLLISLESTTGVVRVAGLPYDVRIRNATTDDRLTVRGNEGDDTLKSVNPTGGGALNVESVIGITLAGGAGNDVLSADAILIGGLGNDYLEGGAGDDQLFGNEGEETLVGRGGQDTYDGGAGFDTILIPGTAGRDLIDVLQSAAGVLQYTVTDQFGTLVEDATVGSGTQDAIANVEEARIEAGAGDDVIRVTVADALVATPAASLRFTVAGDASNAGDQLNVVDDGLGDTDIFREGNDNRSGSITIGPLAPVVFTGVEFAFVTPLDDITGGTGADGLGRFVFFKLDPFENNNSLAVATHLGADGAINVDPTIDPGVGPLGVPADVDWYRVEAKMSGTLDFQVFFPQVATLANGRAGLPGNGDLSIGVFDADGQAIAAGFGTNDATDDERIRIPAVQGQVYFLRVAGATGTAVNNYQMTILNEPAPVPFDLELDDSPANGATNPPGQADNSDTGRSPFDNLTYDNTPTLIFRLDDGFFLHDLPGNEADGTPPDQVIPIPFQAGAGAAGFRIAVFDEGVTDPAAGTGTARVQNPLGFATQLEEGLYAFTTPVLADGSHFLTARVQMVDPATPQQTGYGARSQSLEIIVDTLPPPVFFGSAADPNDGLTPDPGVTPQPPTFVDNKTNDTTPAFWGTAEAEAVIRVYADLTPADGVDNFDVLLGLTVALPEDGTNQYPTELGDVFSPTARGPQAGATGDDVPWDNDDLSALAADVSKAWEQENGADRFFAEFLS
jgi:hypothetical protein